jgi:hypothetical protein
MGKPTVSHPDAPVDHSLAEPTASHSTCVIVLGAALVSAVIDVGALALLLRPDLMDRRRQIWVGLTRDALYLLHTMDGLTLSYREAESVQV